MYFIIPTHYEMSTTLQSLLGFKSSKSYTHGYTILMFNDSDQTVMFKNKVTRPRDVEDVTLLWRTAVLLVITNCLFAHTVRG